VNTRAGAEEKAWQKMEKMKEDEGKYFAKS